MALMVIFLRREKDGSPAAALLLACLVARPVQVVVDPEVDHPDPARVEAEQGDRAVADELADHDHAVGAAHGAVPGNVAKHPLLAREQIRQVEVLQVKQGRRRRLPDRGDAQGQRVMHDSCIA